MKRSIINSIGACLIIIIVVYVVYSIQLRNKTTGQMYFSNLGINNFSLEYLNDCVKDAEDYRLIEFNSSQIQLKQDGYDIFLYRNLSDNTENLYTFMRIEVYDEKYRFENNRVHVGVGKNIVERVYKHHKSVVDLQENQIGYIVDNLWVCFDLDENNNVNKITLFYGP